jgi:hypothetical protein
MKQTYWQFGAVTIVLALIATSLARIIWPDIPGAAEPTLGQWPLFVGIGIIDSLAFGFGIAFLVFWFRSAMRMDGWPPKLAFFATVWLLVSWWPHDNWHRITADHDVWQLLALEYAFHVTLIVSGVFIAYYLSTLYKEVEREHLVMHPTVPH